MDPLNAEMQKEVNTLSVKQKSENENKEVSYLKNPALAHLEYVGEKSYTMKGILKTTIKDYILKNCMPVGWCMCVEVKHVPMS